MQVTKSNCGLLFWLGVVLLLLQVFTAKQAHAYCGIDIENPNNPVTCTNDECSGADVMELGDDVEGDTRYATVETTGPKCNASAPTLGPGAWYKVTGSGAELEATTCESEYEAQISVYQGTSCATLSCVTVNTDYGADYDDCSGKSAVKWTSTKDVTYYILVHGYNTNVGKYGLRVEEYSTPSSDECLYAPGVWPSETTTANTNGLSSIKVPNCTTTSLGAGDKGVWFETTGSGGLLTASTCSNTSTTATKISVFTRGEDEEIESCDALTCVTVKSAFCTPTQGLGHTVSWESKPEAMYYILVTGPFTPGQPISLTLDEQEPTPPVNDLCVDSTLLSLNNGGSNVVQGSTNWATTEDDPLPCHGPTVGNVSKVQELTSSDEYLTTEGRGVWYSVVGTGCKIKADTCGSNSTFDTQIDIYTGTCGVSEEDDASLLKCVTLNDDFCGLSSSVEWVTVKGTTYYIFVHGFETNTGTFALSVSAETCLIRRT